jgi:hypothetical protein
MTLWGLKTEAMFDVWSVEHFMAGVSLGCLAKYAIGKYYADENRDEKMRNDKTRNILMFALVIIITLFWENAEHYIEAGLLGERIEYWFQGVEHWSNRLIADSLLVIAGCYTFMKYHNFVWFARVFSLIWLALHIVVFPHSMYLQEMLDTIISTVFKPHNFGVFYN